MPGGGIATGWADGKQKAKTPLFTGFVSVHQEVDLSGHFCVHHAECPGVSHDIAERLPVGPSFQRCFQFTCVSMVLWGKSFLHLASVSY